MIDLIITAVAGLIIGFVLGGIFSGRALAALGVALRPVLSWLFGHVGNWLRRVR